MLNLWMNPLLSLEQRIDIADGEIARLERLLVAATNNAIPLEPTHAMIGAGAQRLVSWVEDGSVWPDDWYVMEVNAARNDAERVWRSMWLAAQENSNDS